MKQQLSEEHVATVNRDRRVSVQFDIRAAVGRSKGFDIERLAEAMFDFIDVQEVRPDSVW